MVFPFHDMRHVIDVKVIWRIPFGFLVLNMTTHAASRAEVAYLKQAISQLMEKYVHTHVLNQFRN